MRSGLVVSAFVCGLKNTQQSHLTGDIATQEAEADCNNGRKLGPLRLEVNSTRTGSGWPATPVMSRERNCGNAQESNFTDDIHNTYFRGILFWKQNSPDFIVNKALRVNRWMVSPLFEYLWVSFHFCSCLGAYSRPICSFLWIRFLLFLPRCLSPTVYSCLSIRFLLFQPRCS